MIFAPSPWFRIAFLIITAIMISGIVISVYDGESFAVQLIIALICTTAALYEESWKFDRDKNSIIKKTGLLMINRKEIISFSEVANLEFRALIRGGKQVAGQDTKQQTEPEESADLSDGRRRARPKRYYQELQLVLESGKNIMLECAEGYNIDILQKKAWILSDFCGFRLVS